MQRTRGREGTPTTGSQTVTPAPEEREREPTPLILHLHAAPNPDARRVTWDQEVIDNENMGKKSSKVCCIYHKPRAFGESSDESSSSSSSSDEDSSDDDDRARWTNRPRNADRDPRKPNGDDEHDESPRNEDVPNPGEPCAKHAHSKRVQKQQKKRRLNPNAYERVPKSGRKTEKVTNGDGISGEKMLEAE